MGDYHLIPGDCLDELPKLADASVDAVISDPPYPHIQREYGTWTEAEWHEMMHAVVRECRRVLRPTGSAVFILQPNSRKVGSMRPWLWEFLAWCCREWNIVEDAYWWNTVVLPDVGCQRQNGLLRRSVKTFAWLGAADCYRDQAAVLLPVADRTAADKRVDRHRLDGMPSGHKVRIGRVLATCKERGGSTPYNLLVCANNDPDHRGAGSLGHGAGTPEPVMAWWIRYLTPPGATVLDPFSGSGTCGLAALNLGRRYVGIERHAPYHATASARLAAWEANRPLLAALT